MPIIEHISDTALWVAAGRALEAEKNDAPFSDPYARLLAGERGFAMLEQVPNALRFNRIMTIRTCAIDAHVLETIREQAIELVVNLAAGLDARPFRLDLPRDLLWLDVDLPPVIAYKKAQLAGVEPKCRYESAACDLLDLEIRRAFFQKVGAANRRALLITEGFLIYLKPEQVAALARDIRAVPSFRFWLTQVSSPEFVKYLRKSWAKDLAKGNAAFQFATEDWAAFYRPLGWQELKFRSTILEGKRLGVNPVLPPLFRLSLFFANRAKYEDMLRKAGTVVLASS